MSLRPTQEICFEWAPGKRGRVDGEAPLPSSPPGCILAADRNEAITGDETSGGGSRLVPNSSHNESARAPSNRLPSEPGTCEREGCVAGFGWE